METHTYQSPLKNKIQLEEQFPQADLDTLKLAAQEGIIDLKYLDEAGFCLWSRVSYSYSPVGEQKRMEQTDKRYGNRISILGLWELGKSCVAGHPPRFEYALAQGSFNCKSYIKVMDWIAQKAAQTLAATGRLTVVVQYNGPLHKSHLVRQQWARWQAQGLLLFSYRPIVRN